MKIIFLDVDGVLNNRQWANEMAEQGVYVFRNNLLHKPSLLLLKRLVDESGAQIVLSSAWRRIPSAREDLVKTLQEYNLTIHSDTPYVGSIRGEDIKAWFARNPKLDIESYVIIDDDADMLHEQLPYLVQTSFDRGFKEPEFLRALAILDQNGYKCRKIADRVTKYVMDNGIGCDEAIWALNKPQVEAIQLASDLCKLHGYKPYDE